MATPILVAQRSQPKAVLVLSAQAGEAARLAAERVCRVAANEVGFALELCPLDAPPHQDGILFATLPGSEETVVGCSGCPAPPGAEQGFAAMRLRIAGRERLLLAANTDMGLRNALLTLADRLYRDGDGNVVVDPFDGGHAPAFESRHIKTDALNCGPFRTRLEYWEPSSPSGVNEFADWLASFRLTDYDLLAFVRGWGASYRSERFPALTDPQHPNSMLDFYPRLIDRLHAWGIRVWASDIYLASGYSMEVGTVPEMQSPCADKTRGLPFKAGEGSFHDILHAPHGMVCLSHPAAAKFYADVVDDLLARYPNLDGLDFHTGHTFPHKICRCPQCKDLAGNREGVYWCFRRAYEAAVARQPFIRVKTAVKMFGDATRRLVEGWERFPRLEFFCWLRWAGNLLIERTDAPVTLGHEDGGGGLEANHDPKKTLSQIRDYFRDYEPWLQTYVSIARRAKLPGLSWEPALQRELEHLFFFYSQFTWEPELSWAELARRYVLRSERRRDDRLAEAYRLALEANAAVSHWGLAAYEPGTAQRVVQTQGLLETAYVRERVAALGEALRAIGLADATFDAPPVAFDLRRSLVKTWNRMAAGEVLGQWH
ncbi:MAG: hypothetical protein FJ279_08170 [Planctomycetes bacterium]|nr:hypothetical protein [Planctomycetota bacterium]